MCLFFVSVPILPCMLFFFVGLPHYPRLPRFAPKCHRGTAALDEATTRRPTHFFPCALLPVLPPYCSVPCLSMALSDRASFLSSKITTQEVGRRAKYPSIPPSLNSMLQARERQTKQHTGRRGSSTTATKTKAHKKRMIKELN